MRRFTKLMAVLLTLTMCLSLLPMAAFAEDETDGTGDEPTQDTEPTQPSRDSLAEKTAGSISDAIYESSTGKEGVENAEKDSKDLDDAVTEEVGEVTVEKDEETDKVTGGSATKTDKIVEKATEAVKGKDKVDDDGNPVKDTTGTAQGVIDAAVDEAEDTIDDSVTNKEVTYTEVESTVDEDGNVTVTEKTDAKDNLGEEGKHVDEYVGKVEYKEDEDGNDVIDEEKSGGKSLEIAKAAESAKAAAEEAAGALKKFDDINTEPATEAEKTEALNAARGVEAEAKAAADKAQAEADKATNAYNAAQAAYDAALRAYQEATGAENIGGDLDDLTDDSTVGAALNTAMGDAEKAKLEAQGYTFGEDGKIAKDSDGNPIFKEGSPLAQLKAAEDALNNAEGLKAQAEKAQADANAAQAYAKSAQGIADAIKECLDAKDSDKLSAKVELMKQLNANVDKQLEGIDTDKAKDDSDRLVWIEGVNGDQGELNIQKGLVGVEQTTINNLTPTVNQNYTDLQAAEKKVSDLEGQIKALGNPRPFTKESLQKAKLEAQLISAKTDASTKKTTYNTNKLILDGATTRRNNYQAKVDELEAERDKIRKENGANIDRYRLAVETKALIGTAIASDEILEALQKEIDYRADTAQKAASKAQDASDKYEAAKKAVEKAKRDVNDLKVAGPNVDAARRAAEQRLKDAQAALTEAAKVKQAAIDAAGLAIADYKKAAEQVEDIEGIEIPETPDEPELPDLPDADDTEDTEDAAATPAEQVIEDQAVPLAAGPVTRAQFVDYLWRHEGSPEADAPTFADVPADHEFAPAIGWAQANSLVSGDEEGNFQPDELVTVADVRGILGSFAQAFGTNAVDAASLTTLVGEDGEAVLNCDEVLAEFFGEEYIPAVDEEEIAAA